MKVRSMIAVRPLSVTAILGTLSILFTPASSLALGGPTSKSCSALFVNEGLAVPRANLEIQSRQRYDSPNVRAYNALVSLKRIWLKSDQETSHNFLKAVEDLLVDEELSVFHEVLLKALVKTEAKLAFRDDLFTSWEIKGELADEILAQTRNFMPEFEAQLRTQLLFKANIDKASLMKALGHMSAEEARVALTGAPVGAAPSAESLMGRYLQESAALGVNVQPITAAFPLGPAKVGDGRPRLFIPVDARTAPIIEKLVAQNPHFLIHDHGPNQGTLQMFHYGHTANVYQPARTPGTLQANEWSPRVEFQVNKIAPLMVLSTTEASRVENYFLLGAVKQSFAKYPQGFRNLENNKDVPYCRPGAYGSCTHWIGEMPIGDLKVKELSFPANAADDRYGHGGEIADAFATPGETVRTGPVGYYTHFRSRGETVEIQNLTRVDRLARIVFKEGRANAQLWQVAGNLKTELSYGEFANPGWVLHAFAAASDPARVPVVLIYVEDASVPLTQNKITEMATAGSRTRVVDPH